MGRTAAFAVTAAALLSIAASATAQTTLADRLNPILDGEQVQGVHWGVEVATLDGTVLYEHEARKLFHPASVTKLFTTSAAMTMLGPNKRFTTSLVARGGLNQGVLHGDLVLRGGGDANFAGSYNLPWQPNDQQPGPGLQDFTTLAQAAAAKGLQSVEGDVVGDDSYFEDTPYAEGWSTEDLLWGYGAPASALVVHDNLLTLTITDHSPKGVASTDSVEMQPAVPFYSVDAATAVLNTDLGQNQVLVERAPGSRVLRVQGDVVAKYGADHEHLSIDAPAEYAAAAMRQAATAAGIAVTGHARAEHWDSGFAGSFQHAVREPLPLPSRATDTTPFPCTTQAEDEIRPIETVLAQKLSPPLAQDVVLTLKESENLHAEVLLRQIAAAKDCEHTLRKALQLERAFLLHAGLAPDDFFFFDGSGLSTKDVVTPRATVALLEYAARQTWFPQWKAALPIAGVDGTLHSRFKDSALRGHVFAKTGTLGESRSLAGFLEMPGRPVLVFAIFADNRLPGSSADRAAMDALVTELAK